MNFYLNFMHQMNLDELFERTKFGAFIKSVYFCAIIPIIEMEMLKQKAVGRIIYRQYKR